MDLNDSIHKAIQVPRLEKLNSTTVGQNTQNTTNSGQRLHETQFASMKKVPVPDFAAMEQQKMNPAQSNPITDKQNLFKFGFTQKAMQKKQEEKSKNDFNFSVKQNNVDESSSDLKNFMDKAIDINPETIKASIESAFKDLMTNPNLKNARTQLAAMVVASQAMIGNA